MENIKLFKQSYEEAKKSQSDLGKLELIGIVCSRTRTNSRFALDGLIEDNVCPQGTTHVFGINIRPYGNAGYAFCYGDAYKPKDINE